MHVAAFPFAAHRRAARPAQPAARLAVPEPASDAATANAAWASANSASASTARCHASAQPPWLAKKASTPATYAAAASGEVVDNPNP